MIPKWMVKIFNLTFIGGSSRDRHPSVRLEIERGFFATAIIQNILLLCIAMPSYYLLVQAHPQTYYFPRLSEKVRPPQHSTQTSSLTLLALLQIAQALMTPPHLSWYDYTLAAAALGCVAGEYISDGIQQASVSPASFSPPS